MADYVPVYDTTLHRWKLVALTDIAGSMTAVQIVQVLQSAFGRLTWLLSGNSTDGQPDTATAAAIASFISQTSVSADYVDWIDLGASAGGGTLVISDAYSASAADVVTLVQSHGVLAIADAYSASFADNVVLVDPDSLVFVIADSVSGSFSDVVTLSRAGGELVIADAYSASSADNVVLVLSGGTFVIADAYSASSADNVTLSAGLVTMSTATAYGGLTFTGGGSRSNPATYDASAGQYFIQSFNTGLSLANQTGYAGLTKDAMSDYTFSMDVTGSTDMLPPEQENGVISVLRVLTSGGTLPFTAATGVTDRQKAVVYLGYSGGTYFVQVLRFLDGPSVWWLTSSGTWQEGTPASINLTENGVRVGYARSGATHTLTLRKLDNTLIRSVTVATDSQFAYESAADMMLIGDAVSETGKPDYYHTKITVRNVTGI
jgi:hypothetical protein